MTEPQEEQEPVFPDVQASVRNALILTCLLAIIYAVVFSFFGQVHQTDGVSLLASLGLGGVLLFLSYVDLRTGLLPDILTWPLVALGLGYAAHTGALVSALSGAVIGYALIAGLALIWRQTRGYEGIGLGDAKLLAAGGAWIGVFSLPFVLLIASATGLVAAFTVSQKSHLDRHRVAIVFGPCLALGIWIAWCAPPIAVS
ncbi:MAG: A24 family peptidase [Pseudomonadota bacterium]